MLKSEDLRDYGIGKMPTTTAALENEVCRATDLLTKAADTIDRLRGDNGHPSITLYKCPWCAVAATSKLWNDATEAMYGSGICVIEHPEAAVYQNKFVCPNEGCAEEIKRDSIITLKVGVERE